MAGASFDLFPDDFVMGAWIDLFPDDFVAGDCFYPFFDPSLRKQRKKHIKNDVRKELIEPFIS